MPVFLFLSGFSTVLRENLSSPSGSPFALKLYPFWVLVNPLGLFSVIKNGVFISTFRFPNFAQVDAGDKR